MESVRVILEALQSNKPARAWETVDQELKKNPESDVYLCLKVHVAHTLLDKATAVETAEKAVKFCSKKTLEMFLVPALIDYHRNDLLLAAFQHVDRLDPKDVALRTLWLESSFEVGDLSSAQKALMTLHRDAKDLRHSAYCCCLIMSEIKPVNKLFTMLAQRMITPYLPAKEPQECFVVAKVKQMEDEAKMVEYLLDADLTPMLAGSLELQLLLLNGLQNLERWTELKEYAIRQLEKIDSYNYWEALNTACVKLNLVDEAISMRKKFQGVNAQLAAVDLAFKSKGDVQGAVLEYWHKFGSKMSTPQFLKPYLSEEILGRLQQNTLGEKINLIKLQAEIGTKPQTKDLLQLYTQSLPEAVGEKTEYFIGTDALLLAAQNLVGENLKYSAITLLEHALAVDPHQFYVRVMLIELYNYLGVVDLAKKHFDALAIKNLQFETLGFLLATRIGTVSPRQGKPLLLKFATVRQRNPYFGGYVSRSLDNAYTQFIGVFELGKKLNRSLNHALQLLENIKINRIVKGPLNFSELVHLYDPELLEDSRDFSTRFLNRELKELYVGPTQHKEYVSVFRTRELALFERTTKNELSSQTISDVEKLAERAKKSSEFTKEEVFSIEVVSNLLLNRNVDIPIPEFDFTQPLDYKFFHWAYTLLEVQKISQELKGSLDFRPKLKEGVQHYINAIPQTERDFVAEARKTDVLGDASKHARHVKNEQLRKLQDLQTLLK